MSKENINSEVLLASKRWIDFFNKSDIERCSQKYLNEAVMNVRPTGIYEGRGEIHEFWNTFVLVYRPSDLVYTDIHIKVIDEKTAKLSAKWSMNVASGFIAEELWVKVNGEWFLSYDDFTIEKQF